MDYSVAVVWVCRVVDYSVAVAWVCSGLQCSCACVSMVCVHSVRWSIVCVLPHTPSNAVAGETSLDRLANALGGKAVLPHIIANVPTMLQSGESTAHIHTMYLACSL